MYSTHTHIYSYLNNTMESILNLSANQRIFCVVWNREVHYSLQKSLTLRRMNPIPRQGPVSLRFTLILFSQFSHLGFGLSGGRFYVCFTITILRFLMRYIYHVLLTFLILITIIRLIYIMNINYLTQKT
jgi:hypothetical protein